MSVADVGEALRSRSGVLVGALSHPGPRDRNEDAFAIILDADLYLVSDGIGGHPGGDTASQIVVTAVPELLREPLAAGELTDAAIQSALRSALYRLSHTVRREAGRWAGQAGMGATVVLAVIHGGSVTVAHLGDSRAYRWRHPSLTRVTDDHSVVEILLEQGAITEGEAADHPAKGRITRYVGMEDPAEADVTTLAFEPGDRLLLCTDGLTAVIADADVAEILARTAGDPRTACHLLVRAALEARTLDNVTVLVAERAPDAADASPDTAPPHRKDLP